MDEMQKVPDVIYLPWQDAMWCVKRIYDTDIEYVPKAYLRRTARRRGRGEHQDVAGRNEKYINR